MVNKNLIVITNYKKLFGETLDQLNTLKQRDFIVITTKEGGIAIDFQGSSVAHTLICFKPQSSSELLQAIGRGCRDLKSKPEGTLICSEPLTTNASYYIQKIENYEKEDTDKIYIMSKIASRLHRKDVLCPKHSSIDGSQKVALVSFQNAYFGRTPLCDMVYAGIKVLLGSDAPKNVREGWDLFC